MREWLRSLPEWQTAFLGILVFVAGIALLQISFEFARVHDEDATIEAPDLHIVEPPETEEQQEEPEAQGEEPAP